MFLTIKDTRQENINSTSIIFDKPVGFSYYPGQYIDLELPVIDIRSNVRAFSLSSSPTENFLMITYKHGPSVFKKHLQSLKPGQAIKISHPAGTFILDETEPVFFIAGGIGITPFRSMIKYAVDKQLSNPIKLLHIAATEDFVFAKEFIEWKKLLPNFNIIYQHSIQNGRLNKLPSNLKSIVYLSGSAFMIEKFYKILIATAIDEDNIRIDSFDGY